MARFENYGIQYESFDTLSKKTTRTINGLLREIPNIAVEDGGETAAGKIDTFMRAFLAMSTNSYSDSTLIGKASVINLMEV